LSQHESEVCSSSSCACSPTTSKKREHGRPRCSATRC
jgi:hypothetical protein